MWRELADVVGRQLTIVGPEDDKPAHVELKYRLGQVKELHLEDVIGAIECYRDILDLEPTHAKGRAALEPGLRGRHAEPGKDAGGSKRAHRRRHPRADLRAAVGMGSAGRGSRDPAQRASASDTLGRVAAPHKIGELRAPSWSTPRRRSTRTRARSAPIRRPRRRRTSSRRSPRCSTTAGRAWSSCSRRRSRSASASRRSTRRSPTSSRPRSRAATRTGSATAPRRSSSSARHWRSSPTTSARCRRSSRFSRPRRLTPSSSRYSGAAPRSPRPTSSGSSI